jgi:predicted O-methyltransferase YrrM
MFKNDQPMSLLLNGLASYIDEHTTAEDEVRYELNRTTKLKVSKPQMLSGRVQGQLLRMLSTMQRPRRILEVGTYTGYATICLTEGLTADGLIHTIDRSEDLAPYVHHYWEKAGVQSRIQWHVGDAREIIPELDETFDLVFIDADKVNYTTYYEQALAKIPQDGIIVADNVLYGGQVVADNPSKSGSAMQAFNDYVQADERVENTILSVRDGLMMIRKVSD